MLDISEEAQRHLPDVLAGAAPDACIRIAVMGSGGTNCGLGLTADEPADTDTIFEFAETRVIIDTNLLNYCGSITLDFTEGEPDRCDSRSKRGFLISADTPVT